MTTAICALNSPRFKSSINFADSIPSPSKTANPQPLKLRVCISKEPEIYPGADHTSLMLVLPNRPGSLYQLLSRFNAQGINLIKLESRPLPGRDFEFMFYFDIDASVYSPAFAHLIEELDATLEDFSYLGSYSEIV